MTRREELIDLLVGPNSPFGFLVPAEQDKATGWYRYGVGARELKASNLRREIASLLAVGVTPDSMKVDSTP